MECVGETVAMIGYHGQGQIVGFFEADCEEPLFGGARLPNGLIGIAKYSVILCELRD
jgi:hypothetical protein